MTTYNTKSHYRKIYRDHYGPIPVDENGRTFEIHHIDGNRKNNDPSNLIAVSIQEHYDIHYAQKDWGACHYLLIRMKRSPEEISKMASMVARQKLEEGTHLFLNPEFREKVRQRNLAQSARGEHPFQNPEFIETVRERTTAKNNELAKNGQHPWQAESYRENRSQYQKQLLAEGKHISQDPEKRAATSKKTKEKNLQNVANGTHPFQNPEKMKKNRIVARERMLANNPSHDPKNRKKASERLQGKVTCPHCGKDGNPMAMKRWHFDNCKVKATPGSA